MLTSNNTGTCVATCTLIGWSWILANTSYWVCYDSTTITAIQGQLGPLILGGQVSNCAS